VIMSENKKKTSPSGAMRMEILHKHKRIRGTNLVGGDGRAMEALSVANQRRDHLMPTK